MKRCHESSIISREDSYKDDNNFPKTFLIQVCLDGNTLRGTIPAGQSHGVHLMAANLWAFSCHPSQKPTDHGSNLSPGKAEETTCWVSIQRSAYKGKPNAIGVYSSGDPSRSPCSLQKSYAHSASLSRHDPYPTPYVLYLS